MPVQSLDQVKKKEAVIAKAVAGLGEGSDSAVKRVKARQLKRVQRKRRRLATEEARQAAAAAKAKQSDAPAEAAPAESKEAAPAAE